MLYPVCIVERNTVVIQLYDLYSKHCSPIRAVNNIKRCEYSNFLYSFLEV